MVLQGGSSGGGSNSNAGPGEGKDVVELTEANFKKKVFNSEQVPIAFHFRSSNEKSLMLNIEHEHYPKLLISL